MLTLAEAAEDTQGRIFVAVSTQNEIRLLKWQKKKKHCMQAL